MNVVVKLINFDFSYMDLDILLKSNNREVELWGSTEKNQEFGVDQTGKDICEESVNSFNNKISWLILRPISLLMFGNFIPNIRSFSKLFEFWNQIKKLPVIFIIKPTFNRNSIFGIKHVGSWGIINDNDSF